MSENNLVGYIDDEDIHFDNYKTRLLRDGIQLIKAPVLYAMGDFVSWVLKQKIKFLIVDFKLSNKYSFSGADFVAYINSMLPDLPCLILTNYTQASIDKKLVSKNFVKDRDILANPDISEFINQIKDEITIFDNRIKNHLIEFGNLHRKREGKRISAVEEERYLNLYALLRTYGEVDEIPTELLQSQFEEKLDLVIQQLDKIIHATDKE